MRPIGSLLAAATLIVAATFAIGGEGQGPVEGDASNVRLEGSRLGEYWYGAPITKKDLAGKVVLFEIWGS